MTKIHKMYFTCGDTAVNKRSGSPCFLLARVFTANENIWRHGEKCAQMGSRVYLSISNESPIPFRCRSSCLQKAFRRIFPGGLSKYLGALGVSFFSLEAPYSFLLGLKFENTADKWRKQTL